MNNNIRNAIIHEKGLYLMCGEIINMSIEVLSVLQSTMRNVLSFNLLIIWANVWVNVEYLVMCNYGFAVVESDKN